MKRLTPARTSLRISDSLSGACLPGFGVRMRVLAFFTDKCFRSTFLVQTVGGTGRTRPDPHLLYRNSLVGGIARRVERRTGPIGGMKNLEAGEG